MLRLFVSSLSEMGASVSFQLKNGLVLLTSQQGGADCFVTLHISRSVGHEACEDSALQERSGPA